MAYNTNYRIINKKDNSILFNNKNNACYADFTSTYFSDKIMGFGKNRYMEIIHSIVPIKLTETLVKRWTSDLNKSGFPVSLKIRNINKNEIINGLYPDKVLPELNYIWIIDFDKYKSKAHVKFTAYLIRYIFEEKMYKIIEELYAEKDIFKKASVIELFQLKCIFFYSGGHSLLYSGLSRRIINKKKIIDYMESFKDIPYNNKEINNFQNWLQINNNNSFKIIRSLDCNITLSKYKKVISKYLKNDHKQQKPA